MLANLFTNLGFSQQLVGRFFICADLINSMQKTTLQ